MGDCIYYATPFIVNEEVTTSQAFVEKKCAWSVAYHDVNNLYDILVELSNNPSMLEEYSQNLIKMRDEYPLFDDQLKNIINSIVNR